MAEDIQDPPIEDIFTGFINQALKNTFVSCPGKIVSLSEDLNFAEILPLRKIGFEDQETGDIIESDLPVIPDCPLYTFQGGDFFQSMPIKVNDLCLLIFSDRSLDEFIESDGSEPKAPGDRRTHSINDAFAFVGIPTRVNRVTNKSDTDMVIGLKDGSLEAHLTPGGEFQIKGSAIRLGSLNGSQALAIAQKVNDRISALENHFNTKVAIHTHVSNGPTLPTNPPLPALTVTPGSDVSSDKVFASS